MSAEIGDWLSDLCASEPATAAEVGAALVALVSADHPSSLRLVGEPHVDPPDPRELADKAYEALLEQPPPTGSAGPTGSKPPKPPASPTKSRPSSGASVPTQSTARTS